MSIVFMLIDWTYNRLMSTKKLLMCPPTYFDIEYEINAWMSQDNQVDQIKAREQWQALYGIYTEQLGWQVETIEPVPGLPDMVFATDCCLMIGGRALLSSFRYPERRGETAHYEAWFQAHGITELQPAQHYFEGGGDTMVAGSKIIAGYGFRSDLAAHDELRKFFDREVISLKIVDPYFYHLDTSLAVLSPDTVAYYPAAIDQESQGRLKAAIPNLIEATLEEAKGFSLNAVSDGHTIITSNAALTLLDKYRRAGFDVIATPIGEFIKSGGGVKCLTLELDRK